MSVVRPAEVLDRNAGQTFGSVFAILRPQFAALDVFLRDQLVSFEPEIREMVEYCIDTSGKRIRPALVFLSGWRGPEVISDELVRVAAVVEMVHLATLVHDDIMDSADLRRNRRTASRAYGPTAAVLLGDALFAHALNLATQYPTTDVCSAVSASTRKVCSGEIVQTLRRGSIDITRSDYRRIIDLKTAELFQVSCMLGAKLAGLPPKYVVAVSHFGRHLGVAYQIYDDLADYFGQEKTIGKTLGTDFASGKLTLPLITLLERLPTQEQKILIAEVLGERPAQFNLRAQQMNELGVFGSVVAEVHQELQDAMSALENGSAEAPTPLLMGLCDVLRAQVVALRNP